MRIPYMVKSRIYSPVRKKAFYIRYHAYERCVLYVLSKFVKPELERILRNILREPYLCLNFNQRERRTHTVSATVGSHKFKCALLVHVRKHLPSNTRIGQLRKILPAYSLYLKLINPRPSVEISIKMAPDIAEAVKYRLAVIAYFTLTPKKDKETGKYVLVQKTPSRFTSRGVFIDVSATLHALYVVRTDTYEILHISQYN